MLSGHHRLGGFIYLDTAERIFFHLVQQVEVDLRCSDVLMRQHLAYRIDIGSAGQLQHGVRVPKTMEGYVFGDPGCGEPCLQRLVQHAACQAFEYKAASPRSAQFQRIGTDRQGGFRFRLFCPDTHIITGPFDVWDNIVPCQLHDITDPQSRQTGVQRGTLQYGDFAGCFR